MAQISDSHPVTRISINGDYDRIISSVLRQLAITDIRTLVLEIEAELIAAVRDKSSPTRQMAAEVLRRARRLGVGPDRTDLRQVAIGLIWLHRRSHTTRHLRQIERARN